MRYLTAGESHGKALCGILDGFPKGLKVSFEQVNQELKRRQGGFGRGARMNIENDRAEFISGIRNYITTGSPIAFLIHNADYKNWERVMNVADCDDTAGSLNAVRPGHADYGGCVKYSISDARNILERASARETAARTVIGALARQLLIALNIRVASHVIQIGKTNSRYVYDGNFEKLQNTACKNDLLCADLEVYYAFKKHIEAAAQNGDTLGGKIQVICHGMPAGIGTCMQFDKKLDGLIMGHLGSIQAVKSVEIGLGEKSGSILGSAMHDEMSFDEKGFIKRKGNNAGGIEGGITNGSDIIVTLTIKPIPTVLKGLRTVNLATRQNTVTKYERSDTCAVPAAAVVAENALCYILCDALLSATGADTVEQLIARLKAR